MSLLCIKDILSRHSAAQEIKHSWKFTSGLNGSQILYLERIHSLSPGSQSSLVRRLYFFWRPCLEYTFRQHISCGPVDLMVFFSDHRATNFTRLKTCKIATATAGETFGYMYNDLLLWFSHFRNWRMHFNFDNYFFRAIRHLKLFESIKFIIKFIISFCPDMSMTHVN